MKFRIFLIFISFLSLRAIDEELMKRLEKAINYGYASVADNILNTKLTSREKEEVLKTKPLIYYAVTAKKPNSSFVEELLKQGADPNIGEGKDLPIFIALKRGFDIKILDMLLDSDKINLDIGGPEAPILLALENQKGDKMIEKIIEKTSPVFLNPKNSKGTPALILMLKDKNYDYLSKLMIDKGIIVNEVDDQTGFTSLMVLASGNRTNEELQDLITLLLKHKIFINRKDAHGETALMHFAQSNSTEILFGLRILIKYLKAARRLDLINEIDKEGRTALILAVVRPKAPVKCSGAMKYLLEDGKANPNIKDKHGKDALTYALENECRSDFIKLLIEHGADTTYIKDALKDADPIYRKEIEDMIGERKKEDNAQIKLLTFQSLSSQLNSLSSL